MDCKGVPFFLLFLVCIHAHLFSSAEARPLPMIINQERKLICILLLLFFSRFMVIVYRRIWSLFENQLAVAGYVKVLQSLGMTCHCCDGTRGECQSSWDSTSNCGKLQCRPWKFLWCSVDDDYVYMRFMSDTLDVICFDSHTEIDFRTDSQDGSTILKINRHASWDKSMWYANIVPEISISSK